MTNKNKKYNVTEIAKKIKAIKERDLINIGNEIFQVHEKYETSDNTYLEDLDRGVLRVNKKTGKIKPFMLR